MAVITSVDFLFGLTVGALLCEVITKGLKRIFRSKVDDVTDD